MTVTQFLQAVKRMGFRSRRKRMRKLSEYAGKGRTLLFLALQNRVKCDAF